MSTATFPDRDLLSRDEAAELLGVKPQTLASWRTTGRYSLPLVKVGRLVRYRRTDIDAWLATRTINTPGATA